MTTPDNTRCEVNSILCGSLTIDTMEQTNYIFIYLFIYLNICNGENPFPGYMPCCNHSHRNKHLNEHPKLTSLSRAHLNEHLKKNISILMIISILTSSPVVSRPSKGKVSVDPIQASVDPSQSPSLRKRKRGANCQPRSQQPRPTTPPLQMDVVSSF
jgi:hypothetical protein